MPEQGTGHDDPAPVLVEGPQGARTWVTAWYCEPPPQGRMFKVWPGGDSWHVTCWPGYDGHIPCRHIHRFEVMS